MAAGRTQPKRTPLTPVFKQMLELAKADDKLADEVPDEERPVLLYAGGAASLHYNTKRDLTTVSVRLPGYFPMKALTEGRAALRIVLVKKPIPVATGPHWDERVVTGEKPSPRRYRRG